MYFVSFESICAKKVVGIHECISKDALNFIDMNMSIPASKAPVNEYGDCIPHPAVFRGKLGMCYFSQNQFFDVADDSWFYADDVFIPPAGVGQCYFLSYESMLEMKAWETLQREILVSILDVCILDNSKRPKNATHNNMPIEAAQKAESSTQHSTTVHVADDSVSIGNVKFQGQGHKHANSFKAGMSTKSCSWPRT